ncbi:hypothetical protein BH23GEM11_BH23GEM11_04930 [soil metagenome]
MAVPLMSSAEFLKRTKIAFHLRDPRSPELAALDAALSRYEKLGDPGSLDTVKKALAKWKHKAIMKGGPDAWKKSSRNKDKAFEQLTAQLSSHGDSDAGRGETPAFMHANLVHSRLGVIYLFSSLETDTSIFKLVLEGGLGVMGAGLGFAGAKVADGGLGNAAAGTAGSIMGSVGVVVDAQVVANVKDATMAGKDSRERTFLQKIREYFQNFIKSVIESLKEKFGDIDTGAAAIKNLVNVCMSNFAEHAAPAVGAALDIAKGVGQTLQAAITRINTWKQGKGVVVLSGHPGVIVDSIKQAMNLSVGAGLYTTLKGVGKAAMMGATAGASLVVDVVIAIAEMVVKVVWRVAELTHMKRFFGEAAEHWKNRDMPNALHKRPYAFESWFKKNALNVPTLSVLTLNSGICGDKMHFLKMFADDPKTPLSKEDFVRSAAFVDELKGWGAGHLDSSGYTFTAKNKTVSGLLKLAKSHRGSLDDSGSRIFNHVLKFAAA